jgi:hypothetical protein
LYQYFFCERGSTATTQSDLSAPAAGLLLRMARVCSEAAGLLVRLLGAVPVGAVLPEVTGRPALMLVLEPASPGGEEQNRHRDERMQNKTCGGP